MIQFECRIGCLNAGIQPGPLASAEFAQLVEGHFRAASRQDIALNVVFDQAFEPALPRSVPVTALDLHRGLMRLTRNPAKPPIATIGLLLASSYRPYSPALGVMFDRGFPTDDDPNLGSFVSVPREGCAVFVDSIARLRNPTGNTPGLAIQELVFTAVHELGHVFNLWHWSGTPTFMSVSDAAAPYPPKLYRFAPVHADWLSRCSHDPHVRPGASRFLDRGTSFDVPLRTRRRAHPTLALSIALHPKRCWAFEPIHLDLHLRLKRGVRRAANVAAIMDPGHESFRAYIEDPNGERKLYRPSIHCCEAPERLHIERGRGFTRDLPIFWDWKGYTFTSAGRHRVWVELDVGASQRVTSNRVEIQVLPSAARRPAREQLLCELADARIAEALASRTNHADTRVLDRLDSLIARWRGSYSERESLVVYLASRMALEAGDAERSRKWLEALQRRGSLGRHRSLRAAQLLQSLR